MTERPEDRVGDSPPPVRPAGLPGPRRLAGHAVALIGPLLGLLGTVFGLIRMFLDVMAGGVGDPAKMAGGIGEALICTAAGMVVAIPAYIFHRYLRARVTTLGVQIEKQAGLLIDELTAADEVPATALRASR